MTAAPAPTILTHVPAPPGWVAVYAVADDDVVHQFLPRRRPLAAWAQVQHDDGTTRIVGLVATDGASLVLAEDLGPIDSYIPEKSMTDAEWKARLKAEQEWRHQEQLIEAQRRTLLEDLRRVRERRTLRFRIRALLSRAGTGGKPR
ncbi:hypothetical protein GCM10017673_38430 [Streptosporangium violaceochromogenes]|nr:hypothetical protein GCM10017673_38430 [Streptosporangium violaceochromogenes]